MAKAEASVEELVGMIERGELRLPEMQRRYVWRSTRVRDLLDSLYRGYPSGAILLWETDEAVPLQDFAVTQQANPYQSTRLLLDGQQRLTSLSAVIRGDLVTVRGRRRPIELLFNLEHPDDFSVVTEVNEDQDDDEADSLVLYICNSVPALNRSERSCTSPSSIARRNARSRAVVTTSRYYRADSYTDLPAPELFLSLFLPGRDGLRIERTNAANCRTMKRRLNGFSVDWAQRPSQFVHKGDGVDVSPRRRVTG